MYFFVSMLGFCLLVYEALDEFLKYDVITTTKISKNSTLTLPAWISFELKRFNNDTELLTEEYQSELIPSRAASKSNTSGMSEDQIKSGMTHIYFYFHKLETSEITQIKSVSVTNLIGNIGGLLGNWLFWTNLMINLSINLKITNFL